ncbi:hypothetical protein CPB86DRAFT_789460 [Serendipita vermifera]|nr:hypothetical protein CPB86DRAFT_789460 [Serendipita vermifera]
MDRDASPSDKIPAESMDPRTGGGDSKQPSINRKTASKIVGGWLFAFAIAIGNHFFFTHLNHRDAEDYSDNVIIGVKNAVAQAAQLTLGFVQGAALVQGVWFFIRQKPFKVATIDSLFGLPGIMSFLKLTFSSKVHRYLVPVVLTAVAISLRLITIIVPAALSIKTTSPTAKTITVPAFTMLTNHSESLFSYGPDRLAGLGSGGAMPLFQTQPLNWPVPEECKAGCEYAVTYDSMALQCSDLGPNDILNEPTKSQDGYKAILSYGWFPYSNTLLNATFISDINSTYTYTIAYLDGRHLVTMGGPSPYVAGSQCTFHNATYTVGVRFTSFSQEFSILSREITSDPLISNYRNCPGDPEPQPDENQILQMPDATACDNAYYFKMSLIDVFSGAMTGQVKENFALGGLIFNATYLASSILYSNVTKDANSRSFGLSDAAQRAGGLSASLERAFTNITISMMSSSIPQDNFVQVNGMVTPHITEYVYNPTPLMATYGFALVTVGLSVVFALFSMRRNENDADHTFSYFMAVTRNKDLDDIVRLEADEKELATLRFTVPSETDEHSGLLDDGLRNRRSPRFEVVKSTSG